MRYADVIGAGLVSLVFAIAPFVSDSKNSLGVLLAACGAFWLLLTISDDEPAQVSASEEAGQTGNPWRLTTPIHMLVLLYWGVSTLATAASPVRAAAFVGWQKLTLYLMLFALMARVLRSSRIRSIVIAVYLHAALLVSVYGLQQWFAGPAALATWVDPESPLSRTPRVYSYLGNPNLLAGYLIPAIILSVVAMFAWRGWIRKALAATMAIANTACIVLTFSRGGWIGVAAAGFVLVGLLFHWWSVHLPVFWRKWGVPIVLGGAAALLILAVVAVEPLRQRVASIFVGRGDSSNNFRINVWLSVIEMIRDRPILGIGPGNVAFNRVYPIYQRPRFTALSAYSILLEILVETGIIGLTCFVWLLIVTFHSGWLQLQKLRRLRRRDGFWLMGAIAVVVGLLSHNLFDTVWYRPQINTLWWLMMALIAGYCSDPSLGGDSEVRQQDG